MRNGNGNGTRNTVGVAGLAVTVMLGLFSLINQKIDSVYSQLNQKIDGESRALHMRMDENRGSLNKVDDWQQAYMKGQIPSASEPKLAAIEKMFAEVETQFRAFKDRMLENETHTTTGIMDNTRDIKDLGDLLRETREEQAKRLGREQTMSGH